MVNEEGDFVLPPGAHTIEVTNGVANAQSFTVNVKVGQRVLHKVVDLQAQIIFVQPFVDRDCCIALVCFLGLP